MYKQNDNEVGRWVVEGADGKVIRRFHWQSDAIDFAQRLRRFDNAILLIDMHRALIQLIRTNTKEVQAS